MCGEEDTIYHDAKYELSTAQVKWSIFS